MDLSNFLLLKQGLITKDEVKGHVPGMKNTPITKPESDTCMEFADILDKCPTIKKVREHIKNEAHKINEKFDI